MMRVRLRAAGGAFEAVLKPGAIGERIAQALPITSIARRWGEEIYFDVPVKMANTAPTRDVKVGDVAYWPEGPCVCIFFGRTPASRGGEPRPASAVTVIGHTDADPQRLRAVKDGKKITVESMPAVGAQQNSTQEGR
ncbi:MAG: hypothetical protein HYZ89_03575 [Candidatus Omnitrophica bacterium]|nr:hypothetical protein [Candidatus Omnitrophota bacterium]